MPVPLRILVTRPQPAAAATAARLEATGHEAIVLPLMEAVHSPQAAMDALAQPHTAIAVTSAEAIRALLSSTDDLTPYLQMTVFCVGAATAQAARQAGFRPVITGTGTGIGLAQIIRDSTKNSDIDLVYLAGQPRSPNFEAALSEAGIACRVVEAYCMVPTALSEDDLQQQLLSHRPDVILFYSQETARHFFRLATPQTLIDLPNLRILCLSDTVAAAVPEGVGTTAISSEPNEESLLALL